MSHRCLSCYVGCTDSHQEALRTQASQDIDPQEESWEKVCYLHRHRQPSSDARDNCVYVCVV